MVEMLNHIQRAMADFYECLAEFRELTKGVGGQLNAVKKFNNLKEFRAYHSLGRKRYAHYVKKTDKVYGNTGIPSKIPFKREDNPKEWMKQYGWFRTNLEATVYAPKPKGGSRTKKTTPTTRKITVRSCENRAEYDKQYRYFVANPEAEVYDPTQDRRKNRGEVPCKNPLITVTLRSDPLEYRRQQVWLNNHKHENPDKIPPRERAPRSV